MSQYQKWLKQLDTEAQSSVKTFVKDFQTHVLSYLAEPTDEKIGLAKTLVNTYFGANNLSVTEGHVSWHGLNEFLNDKILSLDTPVVSKKTTPPTKTGVGFKSLMLSRPFPAQKQSSSNLDNSDTKSIVLENLYELRDFVSSFLYKVNTYALFSDNSEKSKKLQEVEARLQEALAAQKALEASMDTLKSELAAALKDSTTLKQEKEALEQENKNLQNTIADLSQKIEALREEYSNHQTQYNCVKADLEAVKQQQEKGKTENDQLFHRLAKLESFFRHASEKSELKSPSSSSLPDTSHAEGPAAEPKSPGTSPLVAPSLPSQYSGESSTDNDESDEEAINLGSSPVISRISDPLPPYKTPITGNNILPTNTLTLS